MISTQTDVHFSELLVLRHGETEWNAAGRMQGHLDSPLTAKGIGQAELQNQILRQYDLRRHRFISSPQQRAVETAKIALLGICDAIETSVDLMEIDMGTWSGVTRADIATERQACLADFSPTALYDWAPGGEGKNRLYVRCAAFLARLDGPAVLVTHGMTSLCLRLNALGWGLDRLDDLPSGQGVVYRLKAGKHEQL